MRPIRKQQAWLPGVLLHDFFNDEAYRNFATRRPSFSPALNILESEKNFRIEIAAPGFEKENFKIDVNADNLLEVSAEKSIAAPSEENKERYVRREFINSRFKKSLVLPKDINKDEIKASYKNGVLEIEIPKMVKEELKQVKTIEIA
ncbi:MAG: Hsp20/alpha crystallin family protein [Candidatus Azobacteroides sp.]|nr:Hsp20/alpha crystallin family protein [Candidatus Azobacteroides sp.]